MDTLETLSCFCCSTPIKRHSYGCDGSPTCLGATVRICARCEDLRSKGERPLSKAQTDLERRHAAYYKRITEGKANYGIKVRFALADGTVIEGEPIKESLAK